MEIREFKEGAKQAAAYLAAQGIEVPHAQLLEALSRAFGHRNWSTLRASTNLDATKSEPPLRWQPGTAPMSQALFAHSAGTQCPLCGSREVESQSLQADGADAWDETTCSDCGASWNCSYRLVGYFDLAPGAASTTETHDVKELREEVVEALVDDVRDRAAQYGFSYSGPRQAERLARESADVLDLDATDAEVQEAVSRLA